jgi:hypothetical protein
MQLKTVKDLTIPDLERMRDPDVLGEEADWLIGVVYRIGDYKGYSDEEIRRLTLEEVFAKDE